MAITPKRLSVNLPDDLGDKLDFVCRAYNMTRTELIHKFILTQFDIVNEDSAVHQTLNKIEELTKQLEALSTQYQPSK